jgi:hypothetical protein
LQALDELQTSHKPKPLSLNLRRTRPAPVLCVEAADPGLVKLGRFIQEPLWRQRFAIDRLHVLFTQKIL